MIMRSGKVVRLDDVEPITWGGEEAARFLFRAEDTGGLYSFYEVSVPAGESSLFHVHEDTDEAFFVVEGEFEIRLGQDVHKAAAGVSVYGPRRVGHSFVNTWHRPSKMLCVTTPGGIERFFEELSRLMRADPPPEWEDMRELAARHRIVAFPPQSGRS
jgi:mannose-6-phosphate isomerase-like protein (cupin superfamily)